MEIHWKKLAEDLGTSEFSSEKGGTKFGFLAIERIVGDDAWRGAVDYCISEDPGYMLARSVLEAVQPRAAVVRCLEHFDSTDIETRRSAAHLLEVVVDAEDLKLVRQLLDNVDPVIQNCGVNILEALTYRADPSALEVECTYATQHSNEYVRKQSQLIQATLKEEAAKIKS